MAKLCDLCKRSATRGASRSHSKIRTLKRQNINLQTKNVGDLKLKLCTSCLRTMAKHEKEAIEAQKKAKAKNVTIKVKAATAVKAK